MPPDRTSQKRSCGFRGACGSARTARVGFAHCRTWADRACPANNRDGLETRDLRRPGWVGRRGGLSPTSWREDLVLPARSPRGCGFPHTRSGQTDRTSCPSLLATRQSLPRPRSATALSRHPVAGLALAMTHPSQQHIALVLGLLRYEGLDEREQARYRDPDDHRDSHGPPRGAHHRQRGDRRSRADRSSGETTAHATPGRRLGLRAGTSFDSVVHRSPAFPEAIRAYRASISPREVSRAAWRRSRRMCPSTAREVIPSASPISFCVIFCW